MKIKDCIIDSLKRRNHEDCVKPVLPICFSEMMRSMSSICLCVANSLLEQRYPDVGDKQFGINVPTTANPGFDEFFQVLCGNDFWRPSILHAQIYGFFDWLKENKVEGIVFWKDGEPQCKIKRSDFGFEWPTH